MSRTGSTQKALSREAKTKSQKSYPKYAPLRIGLSMTQHLIFLADRPSILEYRYRYSQSDS